MSEAPAEVRTDAEALSPRPRPHHLGPLYIGQLLLVEAVVLVALVLAGIGPVPVIIAGVVGACVAVAALLRRDGRWMVEWQLLRWSYRRRGRATPVPHDDPRLTALRFLAAGLTVTDVEAPDGTMVGIARDEAGWFAVAATTATSPMREDAAGGPPIDRLIRLIVEAETPGVTLQLVTHTVPAPTLDIRSGCAVDRSYAELIGAVSGTPVPRERVTWLVLRLDAMSMAEHAGDDELSPPAVLVTMLRRSVGVLRRGGRTWRILDGQALVTALALSCDLEIVPGAQAVTPQEAWTSWHSVGLDHTTFWVRDWPGSAHLAPLLDALSNVPAAFSDLSLILVPRGERVDVRCLVRVAAPEGLLDPVSDATVRAAAQAQAQLQRLDGEQAPAVYASAPTGGGLG